VSTSTEKPALLLVSHFNKMERKKEDQRVGMQKKSWKGIQTLVHTKLKQ